MRAVAAALATLMVVLLLGNATSTTCEGSVCGLDDENSWLQHQFGSGDKHKEEQLQRSGKVALALAGGGFKAHSCLAGVFASLLTFSDVEDLFQNVGTISTASAGGWFAGQLAFSPNFLNLLQTMAQNRESAGKWYWKSWIAKYLAAFSFDKSAAVASDVDEIMNLVEGLPQVLLDFVELLAQYFSLSETKSWAEYIDMLLESTSGGDIDGTTTLGSPVNAWAKGKLLMLGTSIITPGDFGPGSCYYPNASVGSCLKLRETGVTLFSDSARHNTSYSSTSEGIHVPHLGTFTPARFNVELGSGSDKPSPRTFCSMCGNLAVTYSTSTSANSKDAKSIRAHNLNYNSNTRLAPAIAAGSALLGGLATVPTFDDTSFKLVASALGGLVEKIPLVGKDLGNALSSTIFKLLTHQFPVWSMTAADASDNFHEGFEFINALDKGEGNISPQAFESMVKRQLVGFADGAFSDNSAVGNAIASGSNEILYVGYPALPDLERLMSGATSDLQLLNFPQMNACPFCAANYQVFQESNSTLQAMWNELMVFKLQNTSQLVSLRAGTLTFTTVENKYFGIDAGRTINLHVIGVFTRAPLGGCDFQAYPTLIQEIVDAMTDSVNRELSREILSWLS